MEQQWLMRRQASAHALSFSNFEMFLSSGTLSQRKIEGCGHRHLYTVVLHRISLVILNHMASLCKEDSHSGFPGGSRMRNDDLSRVFFLHHPLTYGTVCTRFYAIFVHLQKHATILAIRLLCKSILPRV